MVTLIWFILSLVGVCSFSWWPVLIESVLAAVICGMNGGDSKGGALLANVFLGFVPFAGYKLFCGLTLSPWWLIAAPFWNFIAIVLPGGYTLSGILLERYGLMTMPTWVLVVSVVLDVLSLLAIVMGIVEWRQDRKKSSAKRR